MFWKIFLSLCVNNNVSPNAVAKELGIASGSVTKWKNGSVPHNTTLLKIAEYFGVTVEYLLGETDIKTPPQLPQGGYHGGTDIKEKPSEQTEDDEIIAEIVKALKGFSKKQIKSVSEYVEFEKGRKEN
jgi:transcriptional regulator with XRE-family HTH domain